VLRPYQKSALDLIRQAFNNNERKVLLHLDTGAGKTVIFCELLKLAKAKGLHAIMVVRGRQLVDQASKRLDREGVEHGVLMAGHWRQRLNQPIQVCSIDTLISRSLTPKADLIVIDEAHLATSKGYGEFLGKYAHASVLSVTATPYGPMGSQHVIRPISTAELIEQGYLVPPRYFAPSLPNLKGIKTVNGDYANKELEERIDEGGLIGDIVANWLILGGGRPTICFAVSVHHSKNICQAFNAKGVKAEHMDANTPDKERQEILERSETGETKIIVNVGILGLGVDMPWVSCLIMARPTKSEILFVQQLGRGTRPYPGKSDFILLDHSSNCLRHGFLTDEREVNLTNAAREEKPKSVTMCEKCFCVFYSGSCPNCGEKNEVKLKKFETKEGNLEEITPEKMVALRIKQLKKIRKSKGYKRGWLWHQLKNEYGEEFANKHYKRTPDWVKKKISGKGLL